MNSIKDLIKPILTVMGIAIFMGGIAVLTGDENELGLVNYNRDAEYKEILDNALFEHAVKKEVEKQMENIQPKTIYIPSFKSSYNQLDFNSLNGGSYNYQNQADLGSLNGNNHNYVQPAEYTPFGNNNSYCDTQQARYSRELIEYNNCLQENSAQKIINDIDYNNCVNSGQGLCVRNHNTKYCSRPIEPFCN